MAQRLLNAPGVNLPKDDPRFVLAACVMICGIVGGSLHHVAMCQGHTHTDRKTKRMLLLLQRWAVLATQANQLIGVVAAVILKLNTSKAPIQDLSMAVGKNGPGIVKDPRYKYVPAPIPNWANIGPDTSE